MAYLNRLKDWCRDRAIERTTWDGVLLMTIGMSVLIFPTIATIAGVVALVWGFCTIVLEEKGTYY